MKAKAKRRLKRRYKCVGCGKADRWFFIVDSRRLCVACTDRAVFQQSAAGVSK